MDGLSRIRRTSTALPPEAPLAMPTQSLAEAPPRVRAGAGGFFLRRLAVIGGALGMTLAATLQLDHVLAVPPTASGLVVLIAGGMCALFGVLFFWIALAMTNALAGLGVLWGGGGEAPPAALPRSRTALLVPVYNEDPSRVFAAIAAIGADLARHGALHAFEVFVLSDTTDRAVRAAEREAWRRSRAPGGLAVWYRHRPRNHHRKAGNIADWVQRFGGAYEHFVILDADSIMTADALLGLVAMIEVDPRAGLIQTLPLLVEARTPFARLQQFAARLHGPLIAAGLAWWHGDAGNYWGHNAIIRTRAFAESAGLPELPGRRPFGGHVLSHDFVEAALLRRAGWTVRMAPLLPGSYEGGPPSLPDAAARDRRWCQGNLQHLGVLGAAGLHPLSRLHLASGIFAYLGSPLWLLFLVLGVLLTLAGEPEAARYFPHGHALFPAWPMDAERARGLFAVTLVVLLAPKLLAWLAAVADPVSRRGFGGGLRLSASALLEMLLAALLAPIMMLTQVSQIAGILLGRDGGWRVQARDGRRLPVVDVARAYAGHVLAGIVLLGACFVAPSVGLWLAPVIAGPLLAVPLVVLTADPALGRALNRRGLLLTPEEIAPHPVLVAARARPAVPPPQRRPGRARVPRAIRRTTALLRAAA